jgi:tetratricopeptide (TPR) repeat protein
MRYGPCILLGFALLGTSPAWAAGDAPSQLSRHADYAEKLDQLFGTLHGTQDLGKAQSAETKIRVMWSHDSTDDAVQLLAQASLAMQVGDFKVAEPLLDKLVQDHPEFSEAWNRRATMYYMQVRFKESLADIAKVLALEPRHFGALSGKGAILRAMGKPAEALAAMNEALAIDPNIAGLKDAIEELQKTLPEL